MKRKRLRDYIWTPKYLEKYRGRAPIEFRSTWEKKYARTLDLSSEVESWSYERIKIWYFDPLSKRKRIYIPDFNVKMKDGKDLVVEIKPNKQTKKPRRGAKKSERTMMLEEAVFKRNLAKWEAAREFCKKLKKEFIILTEKNLFTRRK